MDEWTQVWDWAKKVWGEDQGYGFHHFFRGIAQVVAEREGWEEIGSSDVWHASYGAVQYIKNSGKVTTREQLRKAVESYMGVY